MDIQTFKSIGGAVSTALPMLTYREVVAVVEAVGPFVVTVENEHDRLVKVALGNWTVCDYMSNGKKINAIKELRAVTSCGLKEAKEAVEDQRVIDATGYRPYPY